MSANSCGGRPEDRLFLTIDFEGDFLDLSHLASDMSDKIHAVKLGQGFLLHDKSHAMHRHLLNKGLTTYLDAKYHEDPAQMDYVVKKTADIGFSYVSVLPLAGVDELTAAGNAQNGTKVVAKVTSGDDGLRRRELANLADANRNLSASQRLGVVMCNAANIAQVKEQGEYSVIATGIRFPGDNKGEHPAVATPAEAFARGADYLSIGRIVTAHQSHQARAEAFERVLENIASIQ